MGVRGRWACHKHLHCMFPQQCLRLHYPIEQLFVYSHCIHALCHHIEHPQFVRRMCNIGRSSYIPVLFCVCAAHNTLTYRRGDGDLASVALPRRVLQFLVHSVQQPELLDVACALVWEPESASFVSSYRHFGANCIALASVAVCFAHRGTRRFHVESACSFPVQQITLTSAQGFVQIVLKLSFSQLQNPHTHTQCSACTVYQQIIVVSATLAWAASRMRLCYVQRLWTSSSRTRKWRLT
jgi:hypothetical protein